MDVFESPRRRTRSAPHLGGTAFTLLALVALGACGGSDGPMDPGGSVLPPLDVSTWYLHEAGGSPVPTFVEGGPGGGGASTRADSARLEILPGGLVEYRSWMERTESGGSGRYIATLAEGTWSAGSTEYTVMVGFGGRTFTLRPSADDGLEGIQELAPDLGGAIIEVLYRTTRPPVVPPAG